MLEDYFIGFYWGPREETIDSCVDRASNYLSRLASCDPVFCKYFSDRLLDKQISLSYSNLKEMMVKSAKCRRENRLGFNIDIDMGGINDEWIGLSFRCGVQISGMLNCCIISSLRLNQIGNPILQIKKLEMIFKIIVECWEPDWGTIISHDYLNLFSSDDFGKVPYLGWLTYFSDTRGEIPLLPKPIHVINIYGYGKIIILTEELFSAYNFNHVKLAKNVTDILTKKPILNPVN